MIQDDGYLFDSVLWRRWAFVCFGSTLIYLGRDGHMKYDMMRNGLTWYSATSSFFLFLVQDLLQQFLRGTMRNLMSRRTFEYFGRISEYRI